MLKASVNFNILQTICRFQHSANHEEINAWKDLIRILAKENITTIGQLEMRLRRQ